VLERSAARPAPGAPAVELRNVSFAYGNGREVISKLDLTIPHGDHLAVVGPSGIGKSTLAALIAGTLSPTAGEVLVEGAAAGDPRIRALIPQEAYLSSGTVRENLPYFAAGASDGAVARAVDAVGAGRLVRDLGGLGAPLDPAALTEGQGQLLALCRALLSPAPLVILDEASSRLDAAAEARAEAAFAARGGTLVVIAHRIASAARARRVLVLDGTRARIGTHAGLPAVSPLYRDLVGRWEEGSGAGSQPSGVLGDPDGVHPVAGGELAVDAGQVVADGADRQDEVLGDLRGGGAA
jgi:ATP-binding cassette subfamily C protein